YGETGRAPIGMRMKVFNCPSSRSNSAGGLDMTYFDNNQPTWVAVKTAAGGGIPLYLAPTDYLLSWGSNAALAARSSRPRKTIGVFGVNSHTKHAHIKDGASNTFLVGEGGGGNDKWLIRQYYDDTGPVM